MFGLADWTHKAGCLPAGAKQDGMVADKAPEACAALVLGQVFLLCSFAPLLHSACHVHLLVTLRTSYIYSRGK